MIENAAPEPEARYFKNQFDAHCRTMIWASDEHVFLNYDCSGTQVSLIVSHEIARNIVADIHKALEKV